MPEPIAPKRRSLRQTLWFASVVATAPLAPFVLADQPSIGPVRPFATKLPVPTQLAANEVAPTQLTPTQLAPKRLPAVVADAANRSLSAGNKQLAPAANPSAAVQPCSAELDAWVDSWFAEAERESRVSNVPERWLRSTSSSASTEVARQLIAQATREYEVGAWLSAETTAWHAVRLAAESVDLAARERGEKSLPSCLQQLQIAREAMREARDFSGRYGPLDSEAIRRMAISHQTDLLDDESLEGITATDASDRYLDYARVLLAPIARQSTEAAQAMDLLAAISLRRAEAKTLPGATALCLRRAALQGQPGNASLASRLGMHLADLGLLEEARWALEHSLAINPEEATARTLVQVLQRSGQEEQASQVLAKIQTREYGDSRLTEATAGAAMNLSASGAPQRLPEIIELTPQDFAAISKPVMPVKRSEGSIQAAPDRIQVTPASATIASDGSRNLPDQTQNGVTASADSTPQEEPGMVRRFLRSFKRVW